MKPEDDGKRLTNAEILESNILKWKEGIESEEFKLPEWMSDKQRLTLKFCAGELTAAFPQALVFVGQREETEEEEPGLHSIQIGLYSEELIKSVLGALVRVHGEFALFEMIGILTAYAAHLKKEDAIKTMMSRGNLRN